MMSYYGVIERYRKYLPVNDKTPVITLLEGNTPLLRAYSLEKKLSHKGEIYLKYEGLNPTGSFKDRGMTVAISKAVEEGKRAVICASTGNTSASASAYATRAGILCIVIIPSNAIALGKLAQSMIHGAKVIALKGNFDEALNIVLEATEKYPLQLVNSLNPYRLQGQKTAAFEICDTLSRAPDRQFIPVGNAGNITAYWIGYKEYFEKDVVKNKPRLCGYQASGSAPIVLKRKIDKPETIATAIRIGNPASWDKAVAAAKESDGYIDMVTDDEILEAYKFLAMNEGIFCEPASAASVAGLLKAHREKKIKDNELIVCILTGHGLKDPNLAVKQVSKPPEMECDIKEIMRYLGF
ncbi:MAG: threonine synthase [Candidatus Hydrogenedentota bacterium]